MISRKSLRAAICISTSALMLLLSGCYREKVYDTVESDQLATKDIGFDVTLTQDEGEGELSFVIESFSTSDGLDRDARVRFSTSDVLSMSVQDQDVEPRAILNANSTSFVFTQASLTLPATFVIELTRDGTREDALETYVTLYSVFETISPIDGDTFARDSIIEFAWTFRDGDGNGVVGTEAVNSVYGSRQVEEPELAFVSVDFQQTNVMQDGASRTGSLSALQLVPSVQLQQSDGPWEIFVQLAGGIYALSVTYEFDPALANNRSLEGVFGARSYVDEKKVAISIL